MKPALLFLLGIAGLSGCTDLQRSAYQDSRSINKYSRENMRETARNIPLPPSRPRPLSSYGAYVASSPYLPGSGPRAAVSGEVVAPAYSPGLYGPVADQPYWNYSGFGGPRYRYAPHYYGTYGYYPAYGWY